MRRSKPPWYWNDAVLSRMVMILLTILLLLHLANRIAAALID